MNIHCMYSTFECEDTYTCSTKEICKQNYRIIDSNNTYYILNI